MRLIGQDVLARALRRHPDTRRWVTAWVATVEDAAWRNVNELRVYYPSADGVKLRSGIVVTVFNVKGNDYRLLTHLDYERQVATVLELLTHAEYDKDQWKQRY